MKEVILKLGKAGFGELVVLQTFVPISEKAE
jgi:hypothetical protein